MKSLIIHLMYLNSMKSGVGFTSLLLLFYQNLPNECISKVTDTDQAKVIITNCSEDPPASPIVHVKDLIHRIVIEINLQA